MKTVRLPSGAFCALPEGCFLALGCFDGLHVGHAALLKATAERAAGCGAPFAVWTPRGAKKVPQILGGREKRELLAGFGAAYYTEEEFARIKDMTPRAFFADLLRGRYRVRGLSCGENFTFGRGAEGTAETLAEFCRESGVELYIQRSVLSGGEAVSAEAIRAALRRGDAEGANRLLIRPYGFSAAAQAGRGVGAKIGYPTLNLPLPVDFLLPCGVYAATVAVRGKGGFGGEARYKAVVNVGVHPTFEKAPAPICEAHLLGCPAGDLHGARADVRFLKRLRGEIAFSSAEELKKQIAADIEAVANE